MGAEVMHDNLNADMGLDWGGGGFVDAGPAGVPAIAKIFFSWYVSIRKQKKGALCEFLEMANSPVRQTTVRPREPLFAGKFGSADDKDRDGFYWKKKLVLKTR